MINAQQILLLIPMFDVTMPEFFKSKYEAMMGILNLEIYNIGSDIATLIDLEESQPTEEL